MARRYLGEILVDEGMIDPEHLTEALKVQRRQLGQILVDKGYLREEDLDMALKIQSKGQTRSEVLTRYLRLALFALFVLVVVAGLSCWELNRVQSFEDRLETALLKPAEIADLLDRPGLLHKMEALRSLEKLDRAELAPALIAKGLDDDEWPVRLYTLHLVETRADRSLAGAVIPLVLDELPVVRSTALRVLHVLTGVEHPDFRSWVQWAKDANIRVLKSKRLTVNP